MFLNENRFGFVQNELKGEVGLKGEKGEPGGGYYDPRYGGGAGSPGPPGPQVRPPFTSISSVFGRIAFERCDLGQMFWVSVLKLLTLVQTLTLLYLSHFG